MAQSSSPKLQTIDALAGLVPGLQAEGKTVVTTNGVYDILHVGHIRLLQQAKAQGDVLILLLNSDRSTRELKGPKRPIVPETERAEVVAALASVDYVAIFDELRPDAHLKRLKPNIHVKGGDYTPEQIQPGERAAVEGGGGKIVIIPMVQGRSVSNLVDKILATQPKKEQAEK